MSGWKQAMDLRDELSSGLFVRLDERGVVGVVCGEPHGRSVAWVGGRAVAYDSRIHKDKAKALFSFNVFDVARQEMRIIEGPERLFNEVLKASEKHGLDRCVFELKKFAPEGPGQPATFTVEPTGDIDSDLTAAINAADIHSLAEVVGGSKESGSGTAHPGQVPAAANDVGRATGDSSAKPTAPPNAVIDHKTAVDLHAQLKELGSEDRQGFLANFGIERVSHLRIDDLEAARAFIAGPQAADDDEIPL